MENISYEEFKSLANWYTDFINEKATVKEILNILNINYKERNNDFLFKCINPSHDDHSPSMSMLKATGYTKCWSCGKSYSIFSFVKAVSGKTVKELLGKSYISNYYSFSLIERKRKEEEALHKSINIIGQMKSPYESKVVMDYLSSISVSLEMINFFKTGKLK